MVQAGQARNANTHSRDGWLCFVSAVDEVTLLLWGFKQVVVAVCRTKLEYAVTLFRLHDSGKIHQQARVK